ncbi:hypothetical protein C8R43DRAFT_949963 [Mycena crocata]|nr:hypothetical protein C8R43DRAFT_949963 [Mycena crocata]
MNLPNYSPISEATRIQRATIDKQNSGPASRPVPYSIEGSTFGTDSQTHLGGSDTGGYKRSVHYNVVQNKKFAEQGQLQLSMASCSRARKFSLPTPTTPTSQFDYGSSSEASDPPSTASSQCHHNGVDEQLVRELRQKVRLPEREYSNYEVPAARGYTSAADLRWQISILENFLRLVIEAQTKFLQGCDIALIGRHTENPQQLVLLNRPTGTLWAGTAMLCLGGLDDVWYISHQRTEQGTFYLSTWVRHGTKKSVKILVAKEYFYSIPSKWRSACAKAKNLFKVTIHNRPSKATSTTHLPNF